jgi:hypothetical protein
LGIVFANKPEEADDEIFQFNVAVGYVFAMRLWAGSGGDGVKIVE